MSMIVKHGIASGLVLILCIVFFVESISLPATAARLPQILIVIIALLAIMMFIEAFKKHKQTSAANENKETNEKIDVKRVVIFLALIAMYIFLMDIIGYFILTPLFILVTLMYLKATKLVTAIILAIGFTAFIYGIFSMFLNVPVPSGILF